jgi:hypothetical protein
MARHIARHHGNVPVHPRVQGLDFFALLNTAVARVGKDVGLLAMQQRVCLRDVVRIDPFPLSVLKKYPGTSPAEHTQKPFHDKCLLTKCCTGFDA